MRFLHPFILLLAALLLGGNLSAQEDLNTLMRERGEYYFFLNVQHHDEIQKINSICSVDKVEGNSVICYANKEQFAALTRQGYQPALLLPPSMQNEIKMWDSRGTYDWDTYLTYPQYESMMQQFATDHPDKCTYMELGTLSSGRKIMVCRLNNGTTEGKPRVLMTSTMHGDEVTGMILQLRLIDYLLTSQEEEAVYLMDNLDIFISPCTNPDGTYHGGNNSVYGATRYNGNGIDLNRHYPDFDDGPHPDGENHYQDETVWLMDLAQEYLFTLGANYHGGAEVMNYPWDTYQPHCADDAWWQMVCHEYADLTHQVNPNYMVDYNNGITNGYAWYTISGSRQDYMNYYAQCREVTIECSNSKTPSANQMPNHWNYNKNSMLAYMHEALYGIHGVITDSITGEPIQGATVVIENHDNRGSSVTSHEAGDYHRPINAGTYTVTYSANGYYPKSYTLTVANHETLIQNVALCAGEGIIPDFEASTTAVSLNGSVNFTDKTWGANLVSWEWQFEGATPSTSTQQNPTGITYSERGTFDVTLSVTNADGQTETVTKHNYISVTESYSMNNGTITTCNALFFDSGAASGDYHNNEDYTMTFMPGTGNAKLEVTFTDFNTEAGYDKLYVYDGTSTSAPQIGTYSGSNGPGTVTATNAAGALTFRFTSDYGVTASGWTAQVRCLYDEELTVTVTADPEVISEGESTQLEAVAMGGAGNYTYSWTPSESLDDPTSATPTATPETDVTYTVVVTDADGNTAEGQVSITIRDLNVSEGSNKAAVYPNPSNGSFVIECETATDYVLFNSIGQAILSGNTAAKASVSDLPKGIYFLHLTNGNTSSVSKIVVE